jgi:hypothetical protein
MGGGAVYWGRGVARQEREALTWEERLGVWKSVKALKKFWRERFAALSWPLRVWLLFCKSQLLSLW